MILFTDLSLLYSIDVTTLLSWGTTPVVECLIDNQMNGLSGIVCIGSYIQIYLKVIAEITMKTQKQGLSCRAWITDGSLNVGWI